MPIPPEITKFETDRISKKIKQQPGGPYRATYQASRLLAEMSDDIVKRLCWEIKASDRQGKQPLTIEEVNSAIRAIMPESLAEDVIAYATSKSANGSAWFFALFFFFEIKWHCCSRDPDESMKNRLFWEN